MSVFVSETSEIVILVGCFQLKQLKKQPGKKFRLVCFQLLKLKLKLKFRLVCFQLLKLKAHKHIFIFIHFAL